MIGKLTWSLRLAISELRSEWLFGVGVAMAVCSVLTPAALLWGTKSGMIETMRSRLLKDPAIREITGRENSPIGLDWFEGMRQNPKVYFVIPSVRKISLYGNIYPEASPDKLIEVAYLPTAKGDPVGGGLEWTPTLNDSAIPCAVTSKVAEQIGVVEGAVIMVEQSRFEDGRSVKAAFNAVVMKVLQPHESNLTAIYLPLAVIERIEDYKDGYSVPTLGWDKQVVPPLAIYDSLGLRFHDNEDLAATKLKLEGIASSLKMSVAQASPENEFEIRPNGDGIDHQQAMALLGQLALFSPVVNPRAECKARFAGSGQGNLVIKSSAEDWLNPAEFASLSESKLVEKPEGELANIEVLSVDGKTSQIAIMIGIHSTGAPVIEVPARLSGILGAAKRRFVEFNEATGELRPLRKVYPGFRLYAKRLEDVHSLRLLCAEQGIQARSNEDRIHGVLSLDAALGKFLAFIVIAGGVGGAGALFTSLYLSIERSRRQFAVLQILGISRLYVLSAVLIQAVIMVVLGFLLSFVLFHIGAKLLASVIGVDPEPGTAVCRLDASQWLLLFGVTLTIAVGSGFVAISRLRFRDPAIVARSE
jgi:hypothetical protein